MDRLAESLKKILDDSERAMSMSRLMAIQRKEALEEQALIEPKLDLIRGRTKELQKQVRTSVCLLPLNLGHWGRREYQWRAFMIT